MESNNHYAGIGTSAIAILIAMTALVSQIYPGFEFMDRDAPVVGIMDPDQGDLLQGMVTIRGIIYEVTNYTLSIQINGSEIGTQIPLVWNSSTVLDGKYSLSIIATDQASNEGFDSIEVEVRNEGVWDSDHDGLSDAEELILGTNPNRIDSDFDNFNDGYEVFYGSDPINGTNYPLLQENEFNSLLDNFEGNASLIHQLVLWANGNNSILQNLILSVEANSSMILTMQSYLQGNNTLIQVLCEELEGNASLILNLINWSHANSSIMQNLIEWCQGNSTLLQNIMVWTAENSTLLQEILTDVNSSASSSPSNITHLWHTQYLGGLMPNTFNVPENSSELAIEFTLNGNETVYLNFNSANVALYNEHHMKVNFMLDNVPIINPSAWVRSSSGTISDYACLNLQHILEDVNPGDHTVTIQYESDYFCILSQNTFTVLTYE